MNGNDQRKAEMDLEAPPELIESLGRFQRVQVFIPASVDDAVLNRVRPHLASIRSRRPKWQPLLKWAACFVVAFALAQAVVHRSRPYAAEDVNHDGRVDILDAFQLARQFKLGTTPSGTGDLNGDGRLDAADVELVARQSVKLNQEGSL